MKKREVDLLASQWDAENMCTDPDIIEKSVLYETDPKKHVARIIFNTPETLNAYPIAATERMGDLVKQAETDDNVKVIIFKGNGPCFGSGATAAELGHYIGYKSGDSKEARKRPAQRQRILADRNLVFGAMEGTITECLKATICQVHGYCYGGHLQIALASDIVIASPDALFTHPAFRYLGPSPMNHYLFLETLGLKKMKEIMLTMRPFTAEEGLQCGLVNKIVPREDLEKWAEDYAQAIAAMPLDAIMMGKAMILMMMEARGRGLGQMTGWVGHGWSTNLAFMPGEFNFIMERRNKGLRQALRERDEMVPPFFRMGKTRKAE